MRSRYSKAGLFNLSTIGIWSSVVGGCPMNSRLFSRIPGLYLLDAGRIPPPSCEMKNDSRHCQISPGGQNHPQLKITALGNLHCNYEVHESGDQVPVSLPKPLDGLRQEQDIYQSKMLNYQHTKPEFWKQWMVTAQNEPGTRKAFLPPKPMLLKLFCARIPLHT